MDRSVLRNLGSRKDVRDADDDNDGIEDVTDNCPIDFNPDQSDQDFDGLGDACDDNFNTETALDQLDEYAVSSVGFITAANPPGGNGLINKLIGKKEDGGLVKKVVEAVTEYESGNIDRSFRR